MKTESWEDRMYRRNMEARRAKGIPDESFFELLGQFIGSVICLGFVLAIPVLIIAACLVIIF